VQHFIVQLIIYTAATDRWIRIFGAAIDLFGVIVIVGGIVWSTRNFTVNSSRRTRYVEYRIQIGKTLLLGLEILVAADIVRTVAIAPSFESLGVLAMLVLVRTFLSWTLTLEIEGRWPWQGKEEAPAAATHSLKGMDQT
jgi:uncharacterized membrane protein